MGAKLVTQANIYALPRLRTHAARVALLFMAHTAKDTDQNSVYFAGSDSLERVLGYAPGTEAGREAVKRAMRELRRSGHIEQVPGTPRSHNRRWLITLPLKTGNVEGRTNPER